MTIGLRMRRKKISNKPRRFENKTKSWQQLLQVPRNSEEQVCLRQPQGAAPWGLGAQCSYVFADHEDSLYQGGVGEWHLSTVDKVLNQHCCYYDNPLKMLSWDCFTRATFLLPSVSSFCFLARASFLLGILQPQFSEFCSRTSS